jgi:hypothetical protein
MQRLFSLMVFTLGPAGLFAADLVQCPPRIEVNQRLAVQFPRWSAISDQIPHQFAGLTFFDGNPRDQASLAPDKQTTVNGKTVALWTFGVSGGRIWVACRYAATDVMLTRELPRTVRTCSITYATRETVDGLPVVETVDCK